jgi:hypothetical protein
LTEPGALPARAVRVARIDGVTQLYFPPFRAAYSALALGLFGLIATLLNLIAIGALLHERGGAAGLLTAVLLGAFVVPFALLGTALMIVAAGMLFNALVVTIADGTVHSARTFFGVTVRRSAMKCAEVDRIHVALPARHQTPFAPEPVYQLVAMNADRSRRMVVADSLRGEALMEKVKTIIEGALDEAVHAPASSLAG